MTNINLDYHTPITELNDKDLTRNLVDFTKTLSGVVAERFPTYANKIKVYPLHLKVYRGALDYVGSSHEVFLKTCNRAQSLHLEYLKRGFKYHQSWNLINKISKAPW